MTTHLRDVKHGDYELSLYQNRDKSIGSISIDIKTPDGIVVGAFGDLDTEPQALAIGRAFCGGYSQGASRPAPPRRQPSRDYTMVRVRDVLTEAAGLLSDGDGDNPEYDRALVELAQRVVGMNPDGDAQETILAMLRALS